MLWSCQAVIEGFVFIWILITLSCQSVTILFLVPVPGSLSLGNDIGTAKSPKTDIPPELKLKKLQIADILKTIFFPISAVLWFVLGYAKICALWVSVSLPIVINKIKWVNTENYRPEQQNSHPYSYMGIHGINIFGQGIQIFLNTFSLILGCQETVLLHKKASFPFIWRLLYIWSWLVSSLSTTQTTFWWWKIILNLSCVSQFWKERRLLIQPKDLNFKTLKCHNSAYIGTETKIDDSILLLMKSSYIFW